MEHQKTYFSREIPFKERTLTVEGPLTGAQLQPFQFHDGLKAFRPPHQQFEAVKEIADLPEGRILIARDNEMIVGYVTYLYPDPLERWSEAKLETLIELGAIEVSHEYRGVAIGKNLLEISMLDSFMENYIVITTEYYWHWDLKNTGLNVWDYRKVMEKMMNAGKLVWFATDDPEICSHPANCLMARIGKNVSQEHIERFDRIRFMNRFLY